jgi:hypothetical protein
MPEFIAHYRILRWLGKGGMGEVLLVRTPNSTAAKSRSRSCLRN